MLTVLGKKIGFMIFASLLACLSGGALAGQERFPANAVFLDHNYVKFQSHVDLVAGNVAKWEREYAVHILLPNVGFINSHGVINNGSGELRNVVAFLDQVKQAEVGNGHVEVLAWINAQSPDLALNAPLFRASIIAEVKKLINPEEAGSYVKGAGRTFDGVIFDFEPSGLNDVQFNNYKTLIDELRVAFRSARLGEKKISVASHQCGLNSKWKWHPDYYYYMAKHVDQIIAMTYDSGITSPDAYSAWMRAQTKLILQSVSGENWADGSHPAPSNPVQILLGFPAYPPDSATSPHSATAETIRYAAIGARDGLEDLKKAHSPSLAYFQGGAFFLHSDGTGKDGYGSFGQDWWWWRKYWLGREK